MRNFFGNLGYRFRQWMQGRYGSDELNRFMSITALVFFVIYFLGIFWRPLRFFYIPAAVLVVLCILRTVSRNYTGRLREREWYIRTRNRVTGFFKVGKRKWTERDTSRFYRCPGCGTTIRVPKGRGRIEITCPRCRQKFIKRT